MSRGRHWTPNRTTQRRVASSEPATPAFLAAVVAAFLMPHVAHGAGTANVEPFDFASSSPVTFSVTGDAPYGDAEVPDVQQQFDDHNLYSASSFLVHVGDIFAGSDACAEWRYERMADQLRTLAVPAFIVPGDNETIDCVSPSQGWAYWETHLLGIEGDFCGVPPVERQSGREENFAFVHSGVLFLGIHLVGGSNSSSVLQDNADWVESQLQSKAAAVRAAVLFAQQGPESGATFWNQFVPDAAAFGKPVLVVHGNGHHWIQDNPFGQPNMMRVQIDRGDEPPVHITVTMDAQSPFQFERDPWPTGTPTLNTPVCVDAGPNLSMQAPGLTTLQGSVRDDGLPNGSTSAQWSVVVAPGTVTYMDATAPTSDVAFDAPGTYVLRLSASDGEYSDSDDVSVFVGDQPNSTPVAWDETYVTDEDVTLARVAPGLLENDFDADGDPLSANLAVGPAHGTVSVSANGGFSYTPLPDYSGSDAFTYTVSDGRGGVDTGQVSITILPVNDAPTAIGDAFSTAYGRALNVRAPGVLRNDSDVEGDPISAMLVSPTEHGALFLEPDGAFSYMPDPDFVGWDAFTYVADDGVAVGNPVKVAIAVGVTSYPPTDDATVRANQFKKNFGDESTLELRATNKPYRSYLKFSINDARSVRAARLRLYVNAGARSLEEVHVVSNEYGSSSGSSFGSSPGEWDESGITWENAPAPEGAAVAVNATADAGTWVEFDVTDAVRSGTMSFALQTSSSDLVSLSSKEGPYPPELAIAWAPRGPRTFRHELTESEPSAKPESAPVTLLHGIHPNPTRGSTWIEYQLARGARVSLRIYNARGQRVRTLRAHDSDAGRYRVVWDGRDEHGRTLGTGVYFMRLDLGAQHYVRKIVIER